MIAADTDGGYKEWVNETYAEINKLKNIFEVKDIIIQDMLNERFKSGIVFDPDGIIKASIRNEISSK